MGDTFDTVITASPFGLAYNSYKNLSEGKKDPLLSTMPIFNLAYELPKAVEKNYDTSLFKFWTEIPDCSYVEWLKRKENQTQPKVERIPENLTSEERVDFIKESGATGLTTNNPAEKSNSAAGWLTAGGILCAAAVAADVIFAKGKHIKGITKYFKKSSSPKTGAGQKIKSSSVPLASSSRKVKFNSIEEAQVHFKNMGIDVDFSKCRNLDDLAQINDELVKIKNLGIDSQIKSITITNFDKQSITQAVRKRGVLSELPEGDISGAYGMSLNGHIFLNPNGRKVMQNGSEVFKHEFGHYQRNVVQNNFIKKWNLENPEAKISASDIIEQIAHKNNISKEEVVEKLTSKLHAEVKSYSPLADENMADMFSLMVDNKREFSKGAMLFYDLCGGARLPEKTINGLKYDNYMTELYTDAVDILSKYII